MQDSAYFGHYNLEFIVKMKGLKELEVIAPGEDLDTWQPEGHFLRNLVRDFKETRRDHPDWCCPRVRIIHAGSGKEFGIVNGGVWTEADEETG